MISEMYHAGAMLSALVALAGAAGVLYFKQVIHSAVSLLASLTGAAFFMLSLQADAAAWAQMMAYAGGVTVVLIFGIFFTNTREEASNLRKFAHPALGLLCLVFLVFFTIDFFDDTYVAIKPASGDSIAVGKSLFGNFLILFELCAILLTVILAGVAEILYEKK